MTAMIHLLAQGGTVEALVQRLGLVRTFIQTPWWGWVVLVGGIALGAAVAWAINWALNRLRQRYNRRGWRVPAAIIRAADGPTQLAAFTAFATASTVPIALSPLARSYALSGIRLLYILAIAWLCVRMVDLFTVLLRRAGGAGRSQLDSQLLPIVRRSMRLLLILVFALFIAENVFGANISAWLAGLGIAGLAVSLAAQDSIKNFFGSITIFVDRPFHIGDLITVDGQTGVVQEIGFRSTKFKLAGGEIVTLPNSRVVDSTVQNLSKRAALWRRFDLLLASNTSAAKIAEALQIVREVLAEEDVAARFDLANQPPRVHFNRINNDSFNLEVQYWHYPPDFWPFNQHAEKINLRIIERLAEAGIELALPPRPPPLIIRADAKK